MEITKDIKYVGVNDYDIELFEGQYAVQNVMAYNSYVILGEKIAVMGFLRVFFKFCVNTKQCRKIYLSGRN